LIRTPEIFGLAEAGGRLDLHVGLCDDLEGVEGFKTL
jgi:hypothetical protein